MDYSEKYKKNWFSDSDFWMEYGPLMFHSQSWEDAFFEIKDIVKLLEIKRESKVLDSCCGVGRHSLELAKAGMDVTGVDLMQNYIDAAKESATDFDLTIDFIKADVREYVKKNYFDIALNLYTSYGYFEKESDEKLYLKNLYDSLKIGGLLLIDTISKEALARDFIEDEWFEEDGNLICLSYEIIEDYSRLVNRWIIISPEGEKKDYKFSHKIYSAVEIKKNLSEAGFVNIKVYGSLKGAAYNHQVKRLVVVARKG